MINNKQSTCICASQSDENPGFASSKTGVYCEHGGYKMKHGGVWLHLPPCMTPMEFHFPMGPDKIPTLLRSRVGTRNRIFLLFDCLLNRGTSLPERIAAHIFTFRGRSFFLTAFTVFSLA